MQKNIILTDLDKVLYIIRYETLYCLTHVICKTRYRSFWQMLRFVKQYRTFHN
jgi:hypothetical protein